MKLTAALARRLQADMHAELRDIERAVAAALATPARGLRTELRRQVGSAGLGQRLANSWRDKHYPNQRLDAARLVYTKAPQTIRAFQEGAVIRSRRGRFLAMPTKNAPSKGTDGGRISPGTLRFVARWIRRATTRDGLIEPTGEVWQADMASPQRLWPASAQIAPRASIGQMSTSVSPWTTW